MRTMHGVELWTNLGLLTIKTKQILLVKIQGLQVFINCVRNDDELESTQKSTSLKGALMNYGYPYMMDIAVSMYSIK